MEKFHHHKDDRKAALLQNQDDDCRKLAAVFLFRLKSAHCDEEARWAWGLQRWNERLTHNAQTNTAAPRPLKS
jgi:hypothetical protein